MPLVTLLQRDRDWLALLWAQAERDAEAERMRQIDERMARHWLGVESVRFISPKD